MPMPWQSMLQEIDESVLETLLTDKSTRRPLVWPSGPEHPAAWMSRDDLLRPDKNAEDPQAEQAEFLEWNRKLNSLDAAWFGHEPAFNTESASGWQTLSEPVAFDDPFHWKKYVIRPVFLFQAGRGQALVFRPFALGAQPMPYEKRMGILDRRLRIISENTREESEWLRWAESALQSLYGTDSSPLSIFQARLSAIMAVREAYAQRFGAQLPVREEKYMVTTLCWNLFQMDPVTGCSFPVEEKPAPVQLSLFETPAAQSSEQDRDGLPKENPARAETEAGDETEPAAGLQGQPVRMYPPRARRPKEAMSFIAGLQQKPQAWTLLQGTLCREEEGPQTPAEPEAGQTCHPDADSPEDLCAQNRTQ